MVGRDTFYGLLASLRGQLFHDADFAELYCLDNGRASVPPSLLATTLLLQANDKASDAEAKARADFDIRWKVALGIEIEERPFAKNTLQVFRAQLILHNKCPASTIFAGWRQSVLPVHLLGLAPLLGSIGPVAGDVKLQDDGVVHDPVNRRGGGHGVGEDALPLREDQV